MDRIYVGIVFYVKRKLGRLTKNVLRHRWTPYLLRLNKNL